MVQMRLFRSRVFAGGTVTMMLWAFGIFGIYFFTSIYLHILGFPQAGCLLPLCMAFRGARGSSLAAAAAGPDGGDWHAGHGSRAVPVLAARRRG